MENEIKREMDKIELPDELHTRSKLGIKQVKQEEKRGKRYPKWIMGTVASLLIIGPAYSIGESQITNAAETLIGKIFGTEEQGQMLEILPEEAGVSFPQMEQHLKLAKEHLSLEGFEDYSLLMKESMEINLERVLNPKADQIKLEKRMRQLEKEIQKYEIYELTNHTLKEAKAMVSYPINYPAYIPKGYELIEEGARTEEAHPEKDPVVTLQYHQIDGEFNFYTFIQKINQTKGEELKSYDHLDSYELNGYAFEHAHDDGEHHSNVQGMRVTIPSEGYEVIMQASLLSKEEMEKILLSMVEQ